MCYFTGANIALSTKTTKKIGKYLLKKLSFCAFFTMQTFFSSKTASFLHVLHSFANHHISLFIYPEKSITIAPLRLKVKMFPLPYILTWVLHWWLLSRFIMIINRSHPNKNNRQSDAKSSIFISLKADAIACIKILEKTPVYLWHYQKKVYLCKIFVENK